MSTVACLACSEQISTTSKPQRSTCDGQYPCTSCRRSSITCYYPPPPPPPRSGGDHDYRNPYNETWSHHLKLTPGAFGAARLELQIDDEDEDDERRVLGFKWVQAVQQRQDLRIRPNPSRPPIRRCRSIAVVCDEAEAIEIQGDRLAAASRVELFRQFSILRSSPPCHPSILLSAMINERRSEADKSLNPNLGNCLASTSITHHDGTSSVCAAWRTSTSTATSAEGGRTTSIGWAQTFLSPAVCAEDSSTIPTTPISPCGEPLLETPCSTPIVQMELSPLPIPSTALLATRTITDFTLTHLAVHPSSNYSTSKPQILNSFTYTSASFFRRPITSFSLSPHQLGSGALIDTDGSVFSFGIGVRGSDRIGDPNGDWKGKAPEMYRLRKGDAKQGKFRRLGWGRDERELIVASQREVTLYDLRSPTSSLVIFTSPASSNVDSCITSLLTRPSTPYAAISTPSSPLTILDARFPLRPILSFPMPRVGPMGKGYDRTLYLFTIGTLSSANTDSGDVWRIGLASRLHSGIDVYTLEIKGGVVTSLLDPYSISGPVVTMEDGMRWSRSGIGIAGEEGGWRFLESEIGGGLWERGALVGEKRREGRVDVDWGQTGQKFKRLQESGIPVVEGKEIKPFGRLARMLDNDRRVQRSTMRVADLTEGHEDEPPRAKQMKTLYDILSDQVTSTERPALPKRARLDFDDDELAQVEEALSHRFPTEFQHFLKTLGAHSGNPGSAVALARLCDCPPELTEASVEAYTRTLRSRYGQANSIDEPYAPDLSLDLALSNRAYSDRPVIPDPPSRLDLINRLLPARLSEDEDIPSLHFAYFKPQRLGRLVASARAGSSVRIYDEEHRSESSDDGDGAGASLASNGVRRILSEWHTGADPKSYQWEDMYVDDGRDTKKKGEEEKEESQRRTGLPSSSYPRRIHEAYGSRASPRIFSSSQVVPPSIVIHAPPPQHNARRSPTKRRVEITDDLSQPLNSSQESSVSVRDFSASQPPTLSRSAGGAGPPSSPRTMAASQFVPGAFGTRAGSGTGGGGLSLEERLKAKKKAKKRVSGF
ncbi:BQ5605_C029g10647 [Microbotryum silenes-dioicae]|uniref:BQ5605_C029g10647 protein n=1 Tax=Microbotryum silenes-dioicae TaxID=796604 RepID=A0A2X0NBW0_9BASI|nr:BQ5605_C029g10647 [Microbotryum silenes-dioicae]